MRTVALQRWIHVAWPWLLAALLFGVIVGLRIPDLLTWLLPTLFGVPLVVVSAVALLTLPGFALLRLLPIGALRPAQHLAAALGLSWIVPSLLLLFANQVGLVWSSGLSWATLLLAATLTFWPRRGAASARPWSAWDGELGVLLALFGLVLMVQLYVVRDLPAGLFGDSYHHTLITQLMVEHGGLFRSWQPYAPLTTLTYHFGFHSMTAWLHWLSGYPVLPAVVLIGQIAGALAVPGIYLLTDQLLDDPQAALWAALTVGLLSSFPAYYVNWGRYTQLAGQTVLPVAGFVWLRLLDQAVMPQRPLRELVRPIGLTTLTTAGLALAHYRVALFVAGLVMIYALYLLLSRVRHWQGWVRLVGVGMAAGSGGLLLTLPWLLRLREGRMLQLASHMVATNIGTTSGNAEAPAEVARALANGMFGLAVVGLIILLVQRRWIGLILPLWFGLIWVGANPFLLGLNGAGIISGFAVVIASYVWLAPLAGVALASLARGLAHVAQRLGAGQRREGLAHLALALPLTFWGLGLQLHILDRNFQLVTPADLTAAAWMRANLPVDAAVFVNSFTAYEGYVYAGSDGGWWLPLLSGHRTNLPPISYGFEAAEAPDFAAQVHASNAAVLTQPINTAAAAAALRDGGYAWLYNGPTANPAHEYVDPRLLAETPWYELIYAHEGVTIWRVR